MEILKQQIKPYLLIYCHQTWKPRVQIGAYLVKGLPLSRNLRSGLIGETWSVIEWEKTAGNLPPDGKNVFTLARSSSISRSKTVAFDLRSEMLKLSGNYGFVTKIYPLKTLTCPCNFHPVKLLRQLQTRRWIRCNRSGQFVGEIQEVCVYERKRSTLQWNLWNVAN